MTNAFSPERWAFELTHLLNPAFGADRFPIDIPSIAKDYTAQRFPDDPIIGVTGDDLPNFDGALFRAPTGRKGWGIIYNSGISSKGRINFTLAHEFGHYLLHRLAYPNGIYCGEQEVVRWDSELGQIEHQANVFAANLLMPLDDFRRQIDPKTKVDLDMISHCADRYRVSLIAAALRWISYTDKRAVLVVSRDGFILWTRSSSSALKTGAFFKTSGTPIDVPACSLAVNQDHLIDGQANIDHNGGVWFREPVREMTLFAERYDFSISLLLLEDAAPFGSFDADTEPDVFAKMKPEVRRREW
jgi:hypothetical protein